jgi:hypothetical protein
MYLHNPPDSASIAEATANAHLNRTKRRVRTKFNKYQLEILEATFQKTHYPDVNIVDRLSDVLALGTERISVWFQNRRARFKRTKRNQRSLDEDSFESNESVQFQTLPQTIYDLKLNNPDSDSNQQGLNGGGGGGNELSVYGMNQDSSNESDKLTDDNTSKTDYEYDRPLSHQTNSFETINKPNSDDECDDNERDESSLDNDDDQVVSKSEQQNADEYKTTNRPVYKVSSNFNISSLHSLGGDDQALNYYSQQTSYGHQFFTNNNGNHMHGASLPITPYSYPVYHATSDLEQQQQQEPQQNQPFYSTNYMPPVMSRINYMENFSNLYPTLYNNQAQASLSTNLFQPYSIDNDSSSSVDYLSSAIAPLMPLLTPSLTPQYAEI